MPSVMEPIAGKNICVPFNSARLPHLLLITAGFLGWCLFSLDLGEILQHDSLGWMRIDFQGHFLLVLFPMLIEVSHARPPTVPPKFLYPQGPFAQCPSFPVDETRWAPVLQSSKGNRSHYGWHIHGISFKGAIAGFAYPHSMGTLHFLGAILHSSPLWYYHVLGYLLSSAQQTAFSGSFWENSMVVTVSARDTCHVSCIDLSVHWTMGFYEGGLWI